MVTLPWRAVREGVKVKLLPQDGELYVLAQSRARIAKERAIRRRKLKWLWKRLNDIAAMELDREELLMKLGAARSKARTPIQASLHPHICVWSLWLKADGTSEMPLKMPASNRSIMV